MTLPLTERWIGTDVPYEDALALQEELVRDLHQSGGTSTLLHLEHAPVYTIGRTRDQSSLGEHTHLPFPVVEINRGGQATYHGPGQLVGYPIVDLREHGRDLHRYLRLLEEVLLTTLQDFDIRAQRREGLTGVWVEDRKIASIGVGVRKWIAMHGFALNVTTESLGGFQAITPCGLNGVRMTSLQDEGRAQPTTREVATIVHQRLSEALANSCQQKTSADQADGG